jgi:hypothetical protein
MAFDPEADLYQANDQTSQPQLQTLKFPYAPRFFQIRNLSP